ncbi:UNVERIFIED_CONTAM: hypothetical protein Sindi_2344800 [Sesamum indicum]
MDSIGVFKRGLDQFAELSGLRLNVQKSHLILSRAAHGMRDQLLAAVGTSIWVEWLYHGRLRDRSIWTIPEYGGSWGWRKLLCLHTVIRPLVDYQVGDGATFYLWQDPWHPLGPLIQRFPRGPQLTGLGLSEKLNRVIMDGHWHWPSSRTCLEIVQNLPIIHGDDDHVHWRDTNGRLTVALLYRILHPLKPKVGWTSLLSSSLKIPRHTFILWLAILGKLSTSVKPWLSYLGTCVLCDEGAIETHTHLFFRCRYARRCLIAVRQNVQFTWSNRDWALDVEWATMKRRGKHIVNLSYSALLVACVYRIWRERNLRRLSMFVTPQIL